MPEKPYERLEKQIEALTKQIASLQVNRGRSRTPSRRKLPSQSLAEAELIGTTQQTRLFLTGTRFLVDTGADVSVIPPTANQKLNPTTIQLYAANGTPIKTYGERLISIDFGLRRQLKWVFIIVNVTKPIIGVDFLQHFYLLVDLKRKQLLDRVTSLSSVCKASTSSISSFQLSTVSQQHIFRDLLDEFVDITRKHHPEIYQSGTTRSQFCFLIHRRRLHCIKKHRSAPPTRTKSFRAISPVRFGYQHRKVRVCKKICHISRTYSNQRWNSSTRRKGFRYLRFLMPEMVFQLRRFLAMLNFYKRFLPHASQNQAALQVFLKGNKKKDSAYCDARAHGRRF